MLTWTMMATMASAQTLTTIDGGLLEDPDYVRYMDAVHAMGGSLTIPPRVGFQIAIGTMGIVKIGTVEKGRLMAIADPTDPTKGIETSVLWSGNLTETVRNTTHTITWESNLVPPDEGEVDTQLGVIDTWDGLNRYKAAQFSITHKTLPDTSDPALLAVTPGTNPGEIELYGFQLVQGGAVRGWLLRERHDLGGAGILWLDHWWYTTDYEFLNSAGDTVSVETLGTFPSVPDFHGHVEASVIPADPLEHYQQGEYEYVPLDNL